MLTRSLLIAAILSIPALASAEPRLVLSTEPIDLLWDHVNVSATYALGGHIALEGEVSGGGNDPNDLYTESHRYFHASAGVQLFLDHTYHGPFLEAGVAVQRVLGIGVTDSTGDLGPTSYDVHVMPELLVGWQWLYHDRYSFAVAMGGARGPNNPGVPAGPSYIGENYIRLGYAF